MKKLFVVGCCVTLAAATAWAQPPVVVNFAFVTPFASSLGLYQGPGVRGGGTYWNAIYQAYGAAGSFTNVTSWADDGATPTGVSVSVDTDWSWGTGGINALLAQYAFTKSGPRTFAFSGIPVGVYDLVLFGVNGDYHAAATIFTVNGLTRNTTNTTDQAFVLHDNYVVFPGVQVTDGTILGTYEGNTEVDGNSEGNFNGAQLVLVEGLVVYPPAAFPTNTVYGGTPVTLKVVAGASPMQYQWRKGGLALAGATASSLVLTNPAPADSGSYDVVVTNATGHTTSPALTLTILPSVAPFFSTQPTAAARFLHQNVTFRGIAEGTLPIALQWRHDGNDIPGETNSALTITDIKLSDLGTYVLMASNRVGTNFSNPAALSLLTAPTQFTVNFDFDSYGTQWGSATPGTYHGPGVLGAGTFWNSVPQPDNGSGTFSSTNSLADDGVNDTGIRLSVGTDYSWGGGTAQALLDDFATASPGPKDFLFSGVPDGIYTLVLFGVNGGTGGGLNDRGTLFTINGLSLATTNTTDASFIEGDNYVMFTNLTVTGGTISGTYEANPGVPDPSNPEAPNAEGDFCGAQLQLVTSLASVWLQMRPGPAGTWQLLWSQGKLLEATDLNGPWTTNQAASSPFSVTPDLARKFYRVLVR